MSTRDAGIHRPKTMSAVQVETLFNPSRYTPEQLERACRIAELLKRGKLVLAEPPGR